MNTFDRLTMGHAVSGMAQMVAGVLVFIPEPFNVSRPSVQSINPDHLKNIESKLTAALVTKRHEGLSFNAAVSLVNKDNKSAFPSITWDYVRSVARKSGLWAVAVPERSKGGAK